MLLSQELWRTKKYVCCYRKNCDGPKLLFRPVWRTDCCYRYYWDGKSCINVAIVKPWRTRVDVGMTDSWLKHFIVPQFFFVICYRHFMVSCSQLFGKRHKNAAIAASLNAPLWNWCNKLQWNFNRNSNIFIQENAFENVVCEMASILSRPQCVKCILLIIRSYRGPSLRLYNTIWLW